MAMNINTLLLELLRKQGSDLLVATGHRPTYRIHGRLHQTDHPETTLEEAQLALDMVLSEQDAERLAVEQNQDFAYQVDLPGFGPRRFRGNAFYQRHGPSLVLRAIPIEIPTTSVLGLPQEITRLMDFHQGLLLVTGPTGSGKTTTLAALIDYVNKSRPLHVITIEDPVEFVHPIKQCMVVQRQVGTHVINFSSALRAALREDPDVILVGELRDLETMSLAITASETGHLVLGTLNTVSASQTVNRIINVFPASQQSQIRTMLGDSLRGVISQQLVPRLDGKGRAVAVEVMINTGAIGSMIRDAKMHQINSAIQTGHRYGMRLMDQSLVELVERAIVAGQDALDLAHDKSSFARIVGGVV